MQKKRTRLTRLEVDALIDAVENLLRHQQVDSTWKTLYRAATKLRVRNEQADAA